MFQTIALQSISQVVYKINDIRYTCYTSSENRSIAEIFLREEFLSNKVLHLEIESQYHTALNNNLRSEYQELLKRFDNSTEIHNVTFNRLEEVSQFNANLADRLRKNKTYLYASGGVNVLLLIILIFR